jgi:hypothetical protein
MTTTSRSQGFSNVPFTLRHRVARFFLKNKPKQEEIYLMSTNYTKLTIWKPCFEIRLWRFKDFDCKFAEFGRQPPLSQR